MGFTVWSSISSWLYGCVALSRGKCVTRLSMWCRALDSQWKNQCVEGLYMLRDGHCFLFDRGGTFPPHLVRICHASAALSVPCEEDWTTTPILHSSGSKG